MLAGLACLLLPGSSVAFPGANGKIAFVRGGTLYTIEGSSETSLGIAGAHPQWSPDGTKLAYDDGTRFYTTASTTPIATGTDPAWSPDGTQIAFIRSGDLWTRVLSSGSETRQTTSGGISEPAWSPDGSKIAYVKSGDVYTLSFAGGTTNLTQSTADGAPSWSPDGTKLAFTSNRDGNVELYAMNADGSSQTRLTSTSVDEASPSWSPDGTKIAFSKPDSGGNIDVWAITVADGTLTQVTTDADADLQPDWASAFSISTPVVDAPNGTADGSVLNVLPVSYTGSAPPTGYAYRWERCNSSGGSCIPISGATSSSYTIASIDVGSTIRVVVTATSAAGTSSAASNPSAVVTAVGPANTVPPSITGGTTASVGLALTAVTGTWTGTTPISFSYQWLRCNSSGTSCNALSGATSAQYTPVPADIDSTLRVRVTANNGIGSAVSVDSSQTAAVVSSAPANTVPPTIFGTAEVGFVLTAGVGTWSGAAGITYKYQWQRCPASGGSCVNVSGATSFSYSVTNADVGYRIRVQITATNSSGTAVAVSDQTDAIGAIAPSNILRPTISGIAAPGQTLVASPGSWLGSTPITYAYEWRRCNSSGACTAVSSSASSSYAVTAADVGSSLLVAVTAKNSAGSGTATSAPTDVVSSGGPTAQAPASTAPPVVTGVAAKGRTLVASEGTWSGGRPLDFSYAWQRCTAKGVACTPIARATKRSYTLVAADVGRRVRVAVTARNAFGAAVATSKPSAVVKATAPKGKRLTGTARADRLVGGAGDDVIHGGAGNDLIFGGAGNDRLYGDAGNDTIVPGPGKDTVFGGTGNDTIGALDGAKDVIDCGPGTDRVVADTFDVLRGCEQVTRKRFRAR